MEENNKTSGYITPFIETKYYINEYETDKKYGGPEEGGWYFDVGTFVKCHAVVDSIIQAQMEVAALMGYILDKQEGIHSPDSVLSEGRWPAIIIQTEPGENYPEETPHYE